MKTQYPFFIICILILLTMTSLIYFCLATKDLKRDSVIGIAIDKVVFSRNKIVIDFWG